MRCTKKIPVLYSACIKCISEHQNSKAIKDGSVAIKEQKRTDILIYLKKANIMYMRSKFKQNQILK